VSLRLCEISKSRLLYFNKVLQEAQKMSKSRDTRKESKKKPQKTTKEKRQEKRAKKNDNVV